MTVGGGRVGALWIGGLEPYMDEKFLQNAMHVMGETNVVSIKVMTNKITNQPAGYGFINFDNDQTAIVAMHRLGGKIIPSSNPPVRFKLNHNSTRLAPGEVDTSIWVGDLTPEVDDYALYCYFTNRYKTVRCAKVVLDESGFSKGYGFVRFGAESEQHHALSTMTGELGLGSKPIKVSMANQKNRGMGSDMTNGSMNGGHNHGMGGGVSPPGAAAWGSITAWPPGPGSAPAGHASSPWPQQSSSHLTGGGWASIGGPLSGALSSLSLGGPTPGPHSGLGAGGPLSGPPHLSAAASALTGGAPLALTGPMSGNVSSPSPAGAPPSAPSPGPDYGFATAYIYQQQQLQQQQYAAAWSAWQAQAQQQQQQQQP